MGRWRLDRCGCGFRSLSMNSRAEIHEENIEEYGVVAKASYEVEFSESQHEET